MATDWELRSCRNDDPVSGLASMPDKSVDVFLCDPPYEAEAHTKGRRCKRGDGVRVETLPFPPMTPEEREATSAVLARLARTRRSSLRTRVDESAGTVAAEWPYGRTIRATVADQTHTRQQNR